MDIISESYPLLASGQAAIYLHSVLFKPICLGFEYKISAQEQFLLSSSK